MKIPHPDEVSKSGQFLFGIVVGLIVGTILILLLGCDTKASKHHEREHEIIFQFMQQDCLNKCDAEQKKCEREEEAFEYSVDLMCTTEWINCGNYCRGRPVI